MNTIIEFDEHNKWFVISEKEIDKNKYSYMIKVNDKEDDFIDEYIVVKSTFKNGEEYMEIVNENLDKIMPILVPESKDFIKDYKKILKEIEK